MSFYKIMNFRGEGFGFMSGVTEYVVIIDAEDDDEKGHSAPGFKLHNQTIVDGNPQIMNSLPLGRPLIPRS